VSRGQRGLPEEWNKNTKKLMPGKEKTGLRR